MACYTALVSFQRRGADGEGEAPLLATRWSAGKLTSKADMLLKNSGSERAARVIAIAEVSLKWVGNPKLRWGPRKNSPKQRNEHTMPPGINNLTEKTNPKRTQMKPLSPLF